MNLEEIKRRKREIEKKYGAWTADDILLQGTIHTVDPEQRDSEINSSADNDLMHARLLKDPSTWDGFSPAASRLKRVTQTISDVCQKPIQNLRILDLACLEGAFSIELAMRGATVVGVDGREANIVKATFAKQVLSLSNVEFVRDDVRNVNEETYGRFDVVLCLGILYHLDTPDLFQLVEKVASVTDRAVIIDTQLSRRPKASRTYNGRTYWGEVTKEHNPSATRQEKEKNVWMSLDNSEAFPLTRFSLFNLMQQVGFCSVYECINPPVFQGVRSTFLGLKGVKVGGLLSLPPSQEKVEEYSEIDSGKPDSQLHLLHKELLDCQEQLAKLTNHPYVKYGLKVYRYVKKLREQR